MESYIVKLYAPVLVRVEGEAVTQVWLDYGEEFEVKEILEVKGTKGPDADDWHSIATENEAKYHPAADIALMAPWPQIDG